MSATRHEEQFRRMIGRRIAIARDESGLSQEDFSKALKFNDRQTLSYIETGKRKVTTEEMMRIMEVLKRPLEFFTDSLTLVGEGEFCWRASADDSILSGFEDKAKTWIAAYRFFCEELNEPLNPIIPSLPVTPKSQYEDVWEIADTLVKSWGLGDYPAKNLIEKVETELKILVLYVDSPEKISGAACRLTDLNTILINRKEPDGRKNFDFAHELFHLLTWEQLPPDRIDGERGGKSKRREQLANNFAAALLMPRQTLQRKWDAKGNCEIHKWLNQTAEEFGVTSVALRNWLINLSLISESDTLEIHDVRLTWNGQAPSKKNLPQLYSKAFVEKLHKAIDKGYISVRRAATLLDFYIEDLADLFKTYRLEVPFSI